MATTPLTEAEIAQRMPVWVAFADLFLDTDPELHYKYIVRVMRESPFTREQLRQILLEEVSPAFLFNLCQVAGEWIMWNEDYVRHLILKVRKRPRWTRWFFYADGKHDSSYAAAQWLKLIALWDAQEASLDRESR